MATRKRKKRNSTKTATMLFRTKKAAETYAKRNGLKRYSIRKAKYRA